MAKGCSVSLRPDFRRLDRTNCNSTSAIDSIIAYNAFGSKHNIVINDSLTDQSVLSQITKNKASLEIPRIIRWATLRNAFSISSQVETQYFEVESNIKSTIAATIDAEVKPLIASTLNILSETLPDFVTFNSSIVDQMQWERVADVELSDGTSEAECNLFALVNEFCCNAILPPIIGAQFTEAYQLLATDLAAFNQRYWALALGLPRLSPIQGLPGAALAQKRLLQNFTRMFGELTHPPVRRIPDDDESVSGEETDADVLTPMTKLNELFTTHDLPMPARASIALQHIHSISAEVVPLVFWTLVNIYASPDQILEKLRDESKAWAQAIQPPSIHPSFPAPPAIIFDKTHPVPSIPYLTCCIAESHRLYACPLETYHISSPLTLTDPSTTEPYLVEANSYLDIGLSRSIINSSPTTFSLPQSYHPDRYSDSTASSVPASDFTTALAAAIVTGVTQLWDIAPAPKKSFMDHMQEARQEAQISAQALTGEEKAARSRMIKERKTEGKWVFPKMVDGASVKVPRGDVRVRIRRREGLPAGRVVRR
jgi:hypothetical protein